MQCTLSPRAQICVLFDKLLSYQRYTSPIWITLHNPQCNALIKPRTRAFFGRATDHPVWLPRWPWNIIGHNDGWMGVYLRDNMGCMTDFGYVILDTNLHTFMPIQACTCRELFIDFHWSKKIISTPWIAPLLPAAGGVFRVFRIDRVRRVVGGSGWTVNLTHFHNTCMAGENLQFQQNSACTTEEKL